MEFAYATQKNTMEEIYECKDTSCKCTRVCKGEKYISLWICTNTPNYAKNTVTEYKIKQEKVFGDFQGKARYDILNVTFICLGDLTDEETPRFLSMLSTVLSDKIDVEEKKTLLENGVSYQIIRASIENLTDEELQQIYDEVTAKNVE